jgi:hypothetical protein
VKIVVVWEDFTNFSEVLAAYISRAKLLPDCMELQHITATFKLSAMRTSNHAAYSEFRLYSIFRKCILAQRYITWMHK